MSTKPPKLPPFTPLFVDTMKAPAWRAASHGARLLYIALKSRWMVKNDNNGRIYLSARDAARELRSKTDSITRWYRELQYYGFIVMTKYATLGVGGKGRAAQWRLTELWHEGEPPTNDFLNWDGKKFTVDRESRQTRWRRKKQNAVRKWGDTLSVNGGT